MRDSQRAKVYASDDLADGVHSALWLKHIPRPDSPHKTHIPEIENYLEAVMKLRAVQARWGQRSVDVRPGFFARFARGGYGQITLPLWARNESTVLHELAHVLAPAHEQHGPGYVGVLITLIRLVVGAEAARYVRDNMRKARVRISFKWVPKPATHRVVTEKKKRAQQKARDDAPLDTYIVRDMAKNLRKLIDFGHFGAVGRKPRVHAQAVARRLEKLAEYGRANSRGERYLVRLSPDEIGRLKF